MKSTLSLKKPLSFEQQAKIFQMMGVRVEPLKKKRQETPLPLENVPKKKKSPFISLDWLAKTYPQCFNPKNPKPLKKGIIEDILKQSLWTDSKTSLRSALTFYVASPAYHRALLQEKFRYDLDGERVEEITEAEKEFSKQRLSLLKVKRNATKVSNFNGL
ncbi:MAG: ProQ/FinO family protein [Alphaproteobacteria bacterium]|nr:ProQ/FinO family protein [Alphaproteobacteria bacterium]